MTTYTIYGASDDILVIEKDGVAVEEYYVNGDDKAQVIITGAGETYMETEIIVTGHFSNSGWRIILSGVSFGPFDDFSWEFIAHNRPDREDDPALSIVCPDGSTFEESYVF